MIHSKLNIIQLRIILICGITRQTCKICDYTVDYMYRTKTSKSPHAFAMCSIRTDLLKQENEKIDSLYIYLDFNLLLTNRNLSPITFRLP
jgi:hypothetical protein